MLSNLLDVYGFRTLNPVQEASLKAGVCEGKSVVVASPTASGKTFVGVMAIYSKLKVERGKALYIVPLRALAWEKYKEFSEKLKPLGFKVALSTGDYDSSGEELRDADVIVVTCEKLDSLMRHRARWIPEVKVVVVDEVHLLNYVDRGPTLEVVITKLLKLKPQIVALSATIRNADEIAEWLEAELVTSDYRPVKLLKGVILQKKLILECGEEALEGEWEKALIERILKEGKQALVFVGTRRNAEALARRLSGITSKFLSGPERRALKEISAQILEVLESPTRQCELLSELVEKGCAFHHAGLLGKQRMLIEDAFKEKKLLKVVVATTTLAMGLDWPATYVIVRDLKRYEFGSSNYLPVLEVQQMLGRAGRPRYDSVGYGLLRVRDEREGEFAFQTYILGEPERITSKLGVEPILRFHLLALVADGTLRSNKEIENFFSRTFYFSQYSFRPEFFERIQNILRELEEWGFIKLKPLVATPLGKRVSELYIDPLTAKRFLEFFEKEEKATNFSWLFMISSSYEMKPYVTVRRKEEQDVWIEAYERKEELIDEKIFYDPFFLEKYATARVLEDWIEEKSEDFILEKYNVPPGMLRGKIEIADWLLYSAKELAKLSGKRKAKRDLEKLRARVIYGVKEELLPLVKFRGIGRVRARKLFNNGIRSVKDLKEVEVETLAKIIGPRIARKVKEQL